MRPIRRHEGWPRTIMRADRSAKSCTTRSGNGTSSTSGRAESVIDRVAGSASIRGPGSKGGHEEEDEDKIYRLELGARVLVPFFLPYVGRRLPSGRYRSRVGVERTKFLLSLSLPPDDPPTLAPSAVRRPRSRRGGGKQLSISA